MHPLKPILLVGIGAAAAIPENDPACSPMSTVFVTAPSPTTETITVIQPSSPVQVQAAYSFTEDNGTLVWLGATPPNSASLVTSTQVVTLDPVPSGYVGPSVQVPSTTKYLTFSSTKTITETRMETRTLAILTVSASAGAYTGLASNGWNSSMSTFITVRSPAIESVTIAEKLAHYSGTAYPMPPSGVVPYGPANTTRHIKMREVKDLVVATINGVVVSWTNNYDGSPLSTSDTSPAVVSATATVSSPLISFTSAASSAAATATNSSCSGVPAEFTIDFDDLPAFSAGPGDTDIPPIFNPYHKLFFQQYFGYVPPPSDPFPPISPPQLAVYRADDSGASGSPDAGLELTGEIGSGPRAFDSAYWIDAYSAYLGCTNAGPEDCNIMVKGYQNSSTQFSYITQGFTLPPCPGMKNCSLALVDFADGFRNLTGLQIIAKVGTTAVDWYMDDLSLGWSNNTCAAQLERSSQQ